MVKRKLILGTYDTARDGLWTLAALELSDPEYQANFLDVKGKDGPLDLSTALTDGVPRYGSRTLTATLECSEGTREDRRETISKMVNALDGWRMNIVHPDYPQHYLSGRVQVKQQYNDMAHAAVTVSAICDPWLYSSVERCYDVTASTTALQLALSNRGRRAVVPQAVVTGADASVLIVYGGLSLALGEGVHKLPDLLLPPGDTVVTYSGTGALRISYREAVLR